MSLKNFFKTKKKKIKNKTNLKLKAKKRKEKPCKTPQLKLIEEEVLNAFLILSSSVKIKLMESPVQTNQ